ncbi:MAG TPA: hypothetical protein VGI95_10685 [Caulobacteraceae bacterium]|jgi:hypothetical protein
MARRALADLEERLPAPRPTARMFRLPVRHRRQEATSAGRQTNVAAAVLALSVLADSSVEHYRGSFRNPAMVAPLGAAALTLAASLLGAADDRPQRHTGRDAVYALAALVGVVGLGFHAYNIGKRPGRLSWHNLFYGAPVGAPAALALAGVLGRVAEKVREGERVFGLSADRVLAAVSAIGLAGTVGEAGLLHFRGAFQNPAMVLPVAAPPVAAGLLGAMALSPSKPLGRIARLLLRLTAGLGVAGVGFHAFGVHRAMGGWRNWRQNLINGPPLPAPPSFSGLALAGLAALALMRGRDDD